MTHFEGKLIAGTKNLLIVFYGSIQFVSKRFDQIGLNGKQGNRLSLLPNLNKKILQTVIDQLCVATHLYTILVQYVIVSFEQNGKCSFIALPETIPNNIVAVGLQSVWLAGVNLLPK